MSKRERRLHKRHELPCPVTIIGKDGQVLAQVRATNISDGGMFMPVPVESLTTCKAELKLNFSVPRTTANTYMLEDFDCLAHVVRHQPLQDENLAGVALRFSEPLQLAIEV